MKPRLIALLILLVILVVFSGCTQQSQSAQQGNDLAAKNSNLNSELPSQSGLQPETQPPLPEPDNNSNTPVTSLFTVTRVIDGDTIELSNGETVRFVCINTPEKGQPGFQEAKEFLTREFGIEVV